MPVSITEDIKSISDLKRHAKEIFAQLHRTGRPVVITVNGKPNAVLLDAVQFEKKLMTLNMAALLAVGEADVRVGRVRPAREALRALQHAHKISR